MSTTATSLTRRLGAWSAERFPPANAVVIALVAMAAVLTGRALTGGDPAPQASDTGAFAALWAYFLLLRVFDEHKDFERDSVNHPDRVLQRGDITLDHLKLLGTAAFVVGALVSVEYDGGLGRVTAMWALTMAWSLLMLKEFFIDWLEDAPLLYAVSHMVSMPLAFLWMAQIGAGGEQMPADVLWLAGLGALAGATMEVGRKLRAPEDERPLVDTYTKHLGVRGAAVTVAVLAALGGVAAGGLLAAAGELDALAAAGLCAAAAPAIALALRFARVPTAERAGHAEAGSGLAVVLLLVVVIAAVI